MTHRKKAIIVGLLFFAQMITAAIGTSLIQAFKDGDANKVPLTIGVLLMACSGVAVVAIGLLMYRILKPFNETLAYSYPVLRIIEFTVSTICGMYLLAKLEVVPNYLLWVYIPTALGGLALTYLLFTSRLVPRSIALLGLVGYALLLLGVPLDLMGVLEMDKGMGQLLLAPGGLFEFVFLPLWLLFKGFKPIEQQVAH